MDVDSPSEKYNASLSYLDAAVEQKGVVSDADRDAITELLDAYDERIHEIPKPEGERHRKLRTLSAWCDRLRTTARRLDTNLTEASADNLNGLWSDMATGDHPDVKDDGVSNNTLNAYQGTARRFYEYHNTLGVDRDDISMVTTEKESVDESDMFSPDEIEALRDAIDNPRDRALHEMLVYTGQRIRALQTLRVKDIRLDESRFYLNEDDGGLKGADGGRPLLGAENYIRDWLQNYHPNPDNGDAYVFCHRQKYRADTNGESPISQRSINRMLKGAANEAGVDKPVNAHNFRHYFVTICKRKYDMDDSTVKALIGHEQDSRVMERTYAHLSDEEYAQAAEIAVGKRDPDDENNPHSPEMCPTCNEPLPDGAKACSRCGQTFTPDAKSVEDDIDERLYEGQKEAEDDRESEAVDDLKEAIENNPEVLQTLVDELSDE